ncbi:MAG: heme-binding protein [Isosphaeraceae bacterium]
MPRFMFKAFVVVAVVAAITNESRAQKPAESQSKVTDGGGLFSLQAVRSAQASLEAIEAKSKIPVFIETLATLNGKSAVEASIEQIRRAGVEGIFVLIARKEQKLEWHATPSLAARFTKEQLQRVNEAFVKSFNSGAFDDGLRSAVDVIRAIVSEPLPQNAAPAEPGPATASPLIVRNQVKLTLDGAKSLIAGAEAKAASMNLKMNIAVVDDGGHLLAFVRMNGARPASGYTAITKATTAATFRRPTGPLPGPNGEVDVMLNLSLQNAAAASGGKITTLLGGLPVEVDGQIIGGIGIGGGSGEQDVEVARAGLAKFLSDLSSPSQREPRRSTAKLETPRP